MVWEDPHAPFRALLSKGLPGGNGALAEVRRAESGAFLQEIQLCDIKIGGIR